MTDVQIRRFINYSGSVVRVPAASFSLCSAQPSWTHTVSLVNDQLLEGSFCPA